MYSSIKKISALTIACMMLFMFVGCNTQVTPPEPIDIATTAPNTQEPSPTGNAESEPPVPATVVPATAIPEPTDTVLPTETPSASETEVPVTDAPTAIPTVAPTIEINTTTPPHDDVHYVSIGTETKPARNTMPLELYGLSESTCESWFSDAVFVGDSITLGWRNYNNIMLEDNPNFFGHTRFLCEGSYGVGHAFDPISENSLHPLYGGEQHYVWDSIAMMGANKVFILFGLNDLSIYGVDGTAERFDELTDNIEQSRPGVQIFIISAMYMYRGSERPKLNNANLYKLNKKLVQMCNRKNYIFVNIASHLIDKDGFVPDEYSSDHYVHQTYKAYAVWAQILRSVAARDLRGIDQVIFTLPQ